MNRLTLAGQVALVVAIAIFLAQFFNLALAVDHRRDLALAQSVAPAAQRIALAAERPDFFERREMRRQRHAEHSERALRGPRGRFLRPSLSDSDPVSGDMQRIDAAERALNARLTDTGIDARAVRVAEIEPSERGNRRPILLYAAQLEDGRWVSLRAPGPPTMRPLIMMLTLQSLVIGLAILIPTLLLLRRVGGSLTRLRDTALAFDGAVPTDQVTARGPRDVRTLIEAVNAM